jgi:hypothetical protein
MSLCLIPSSKRVFSNNEGLSLLKRLGAAVNLENNKSIVDSLNVFPVPDGDTGTNMNLTVQAAVREINNLSESTITALSSAAANGSLMGARGNSGVILSQLFRGMAKGLSGVNQIDCKTLAEALRSASDTAYKAVMRPVEGTMLTVARETAEKAMATYEEYEDIISFFDSLVQQAKDTLARTPEMLSVLKQADVVDAGGKGLVFLMEGGLAALKGAEIKEEKKEKAVIETEVELEEFSSEDEIIFTYCTEFIIKNPLKTAEEFLSKIYECRHNLKYWNQEEYIGIGPSAHSFMGNTRYSNPSNLKEYTLSSGKEGFKRNIQEVMDEDELMFEYIMLRLRLTEGLKFAEFKNKFNRDFEETYKAQIEKLLKDNLIYLDDEGIRLTHRGMDISNYVFASFM